MPIKEQCQLGCAVCRILCYTLWRKICCKKPMAARPDFPVICLGLDGSGKSTVLTLLAGETLENVTGPTTGFSIKAVQFKDCVLNIKEIGGAEKIRPFWKHYYADTQGVIFVVNSADTEENLATASDVIQTTFADPALNGLPCLILGNFQDLPAARSSAELKTILDLDEVCSGREWVFLMTSKKDTDNLKIEFSQFTKLFVSPDAAKNQTEGEESVGASGFNQI